MPPPEKRKTAIIKPPPEAVMWMCQRTALTQTASGKHVRGTRMQWPTANADGQVIELFPVAEFSTKRVLELWGPGRYRVEWYNGAEEHMKGQGCAFVVQKPPGHDDKMPATGGRRRRPRRDDDDEPAPEYEGVPVHDGRVSILDMMALMGQRDERAERRQEQALERARQEAAAAVERDRQFFTTMLQLTRPAGGAPASVDVAQLSREMQLTVRENMLQLREELGMRRVEEAHQERREREDDSPIARIGETVLEELEEQLPDALREGIPAVIEYFKNKGYKPSTTVQAAIDAARGLNGRANGS